MRLTKNVSFCLGKKTTWKETYRVPHVVAGQLLGAVSLLTLGTYHDGIDDVEPRVAMPILEIEQLTENGRQSIFRQNTK